MGACGARGSAPWRSSRFIFITCSSCHDWASGPQDGPVPVGRGARGRQAFCGASTSAIASRTRLSARPAPSSDRAFQQRGGSDTRRHRRPRHAVNRIEWANARALAQLGLDLDARRRPADRQPRPAAGVPALSRMRRLRRRRSSCRPVATPGSRSRSQIVPFCVRQESC